MDDDYDDDGMEFAEGLVEALKARAEKMRRAHEANVLAEMEKGLLSVPSQPNVASNQVPEPGYCHPYWDEQTGLRAWLTDWLNQGTDYRVIVPIRPTWRIQWTTELSSPQAMLPRTLTLQRQRAWGNAPYVGDPFVYVWHVARDEYGRWIAGDTTIHYVPGGRA